MTFDPEVPQIGVQLAWNEAANGWELVGTGELLDTGAIHTEIRSHAAISSNAFDGITISLFESDMAIDTWQATMLDEIKNGHTANAMFAAGGESNMTPEAFARLQVTIDKEAQFLGQMADDIAAGKVSPLQARARAKQYSQAMEQSYWNEWKAFDNPAEWNHLPLLTNSPGDGSTRCHGNCQCTVVLTDSGAEWLLGVADHCDDCIALAGGGPYRTV